MSVEKETCKNCKYLIIDEIYLCDTKDGWYPSMSFVHCDKWEPIEEVEE